MPPKVKALLLRWGESWGRAELSSRWRDLFGRQYPLGSQLFFRLHGGVEGLAGGDGAELAAGDDQAASALQRDPGGLGEALAGGR